MTKLCERPLRTGPCKMRKAHKGRCSTVTFYCEGCTRIVRGSPTETVEAKLWDGTVDDRFNYCYLCANNIEGRA